MKYVLIYEQSSVVVLARVRIATTNSFLTPESTTSVNVQTLDASTHEVTATINPAVADVVFPTLQMDHRWREDELGYNVAIPLNHHHFPEGATNYSIEIHIEPNDGYDIRFAIDVRTKDLLSV